jgi:hypothetical protein
MVITKKGYSMKKLQLLALSMLLSTSMVMMHANVVEQTTTTTTTPVITTVVPNDTMVTKTTKRRSFGSGYSRKPMLTGEQRTTIETRRDAMNPDERHAQRQVRKTTWESMSPEERSTRVTTVKTMTPEERKSAWRSKKRQVTSNGDVVTTTEQTTVVPS